MKSHTTSRLKIAAIACVVHVAAFAIGAQGTPPARAEAAGEARPSSGYRLLWADEFDRDGQPDSRNWVYERGFVRNEELQWFQPENASCKNGLLIIEARRERLKNPRYNPTSRRWKRNRQFADYSSACLKTMGRHEWTYGRFEMRGRIDTRPGLWPAFWTLGSARPWPGCGEVDILEYYQGKLLANACWAGNQRWTPVWDSIQKPLSHFADPDWSSKFHVWRMDWDEDRINLYVDDALLNTIPLQETINGDREGANPFHEPHYIILSLSVGGTRGGDPSQTEFPARFEVDYVRVYGLARK